MIESTAASGWSRVDAALDELLALDPSARTAAIAAIGTRDPAFAAELASLASHLEGDDARFDRPALDALAGLAMTAANLPPGTRLGPWCVDALLGRGGMGEVYRAHRGDGQFEQQVAIKLMRIDAATQGTRFLAERQIVARLDHPGIARLLDGDVAPDGRPYMVMELVEGRDIVAWCAEHRPTLERRLALFDEVCDAVAYAHRHLVVHRDLKPANVMVTADGRAKLLDFGIARMLDAPSGLTTSEALLTPGYAAPEQLAGEPITTAADVHALGLLLHELLCGEPARAVRHLPVAAAMHAVLTQDPAAPSRVAASKATPPVPAAELSGDLDAIVAKALRKEPAQRYASVDALRDDVGRHLRHEPVLARRGSRMYVIGRGLRRHRAWAIGASIAVVAIVAGSAATLWQAREAHAEAARARAVQDFLLSVFRAAAPDQAQGKDISVKALMSRGTANLDDKLHGQPQALAELHGELGDIYDEMGDDDAALQHLERALAGFSSLGLERSRAGIDALFVHAVVLLHRQKYADARAELERCLQWGERAFGPAHRWAVSAREKLAFIDLELGHNEEAMRTALSGLAQPVNDDVAYDRWRRLRLRSVIGQIQTDSGDYAGARKTFQQMLEDGKGVPQFLADDTLVARVQMARAAYYAGDFAAALREAQAFVPDMERVLGPNHMNTLAGRGLLSQALAGVGRYDEAIIVQQETLARVPAGEPMRLAVEQSILAAHFKRAQRYGEALPPIVESRRAYEAQLPATNPDSLFVRRLHGEILLGAGQIREGTALVESVRDLGQKTPGYQDLRDWPAALMAVAEARRLAGDWRGAARSLDEACAAWGKMPHPPGPPMLPSVRCEAERAWVLAMMEPRSAAARHGFAEASHAYATRFVEGHPARADLAMMQVELDRAAGRVSSDEARAASASWQVAMHRPWPGRLIELH
ncbi:MAG TPA: serine/threonine-protein kinase [Caldimonas sp.]|nr:serine/threonine-protein kinase [Caldimonas sp.]